MDDGRMVHKSSDSPGREPIRPFGSLPKSTNFAAANKDSAENIDLEQKLLDELKQTSHAPESDPKAGKDDNDTPAAQLVSELFESLKAKSNTPKSSSVNVQKEKSEEKTIDFKANLRKVKKPEEPEEAKNADSHQIDFKSTLKKRGGTEKKGKFIPYILNINYLIAFLCPQICQKHQQRKQLRATTSSTSKPN